MKTWKTATRTLLAAGLTALCLTSHLAQADDKEGMREREGLAPKVMIISMFGPEGQVWLDKLGPWRDVAVPGLSPDYPTVHCNKAAVCVMTTGYLGINTKSPSEKPPLDYRTEVFQLDEALLQKAYALSRSVPLSDGAEAKVARAKFPSAPANQPPNRRTTPPMRPSNEARHSSCWTSSAWCRTSPVAGHNGRKACPNLDAAGLRAGVFGVPMLERKPQVLKPNYQFEKRQRENEKKKKKAEKAERKASGISEEPEAQGQDLAPAAEPVPPEQR
jgi:hypothetical protein